MSVRSSLRRVPAIVRAQPILLVPAAALALPVVVARAVDPGRATAAWLVLAGALPFVHAGLIGMANDAAAGRRASLVAFFAHGTRNCVPVFGAYLLLATAFVAAAVATLAVGLAASVAVAGGGVGGLVVSADTLDAAVVVAAVVALVSAQWFGQAVVVGGASGDRRLASLVRRDVVSALGYAAITLGGGLLVGGGAVALDRLVLAGSTAGAALVALGAATALVAVAATALATFSVVRYRDLAGLEPATPDDARADG